ncbi:hypothetical protein C4553_01715 [Candidatus Parcubacteria bacterium]|nr:MAG: hypothetical protein C4553_01715 [Candidatus Parcubacteria bacterium]
MNKGFISVADLAKSLSLSRITIFKKIKGGDITAYKVGRSFIIPTDKLPMKLRVRGEAGFKTLILPKL